jgi:hypothetical protein
MKKFVFVGIYIFFNSLLFSQEIIDFSQYHERKIGKAEGAWNENSPKEYWDIGSRFRSVVHFLNRQENRSDYVWFTDDSAATIFLYNNELPLIEKGQVVVIYYRKRHHGNMFDGPRFELEHIELTNDFFIIGNEYQVKDNLRLRTKEGIDGNIILTIQKFANVIILEVGKKEETIDGITSVWVKVNYKGNIGWCFGGYIHNHVIEFLDVY